MSRVYATGYIGDYENLQLTPAPLALANGAVEAGIDRICSCGFGRWGLIAQGVLHTGCHASLQQLPGLRAAFGWAHALAIHEDGSVSEYEISEDGLTEAQYSSDPASLCVTLGKPCVDVAAGEQHSLAVTEDGTLFAWGANQSAQLGTADRHFHERPQEIQLEGLLADAQAVLHRTIVSQVACGARHSCAVTAAGALFCWGWNLHGQCGNGAVSDSVAQPQLVQMPPHLQCISVAAIWGPTGRSAPKRGAPAFEATTRVAAGLGHTVACFQDGSTYAWGLNTDGQLGLGDDTARSTPHLLEAAVLEDLDVVQVAGGARHTALRTACGKVFVCGWGKWGQLGLGNRNSRLEPQMLPVVDSRSTVVGVACGWWHTLLHVADAKVPGRAH